MKQFFITTVILFCVSVTNAQFTQTDSLNLGEDQTTHSFASAGNVLMGSYYCPYDTALRVGNNSGGDYAQFNLAVTANTDSVKLEIVMPWHGGTTLPRVWVENTWARSIPFAGNGNCAVVTLTFGGISAMTADGMISVKLLDSVAGFDMDGQFTHIKAFSKMNSSVAESYRMKKLWVYPNPSQGVFTIKTTGLQQMAFEVLDVTGHVVHRDVVTGTKIVRLAFLRKGMYLLRTEMGVERIVIE